MDKAQGKKAYTAPELIVYGNVEKITGGKWWDGADGGIQRQDGPGGGGGPGPGS